TGIHQTLIEILVTLQPFLLQTLDLILLFLEHATQLRDLSLHLLQLHEEHALRRRRSRSPAFSIGTTITRPRRRRIPRAARGASRLIFDYWHLCRCEQRQAKYNKGQSMAVLEHGLLLAQLYTAVLSPGLLVVTHGNRTLFAVGNQFQLSWGNTLQNQVTLYGLGT